MARPEKLRITIVQGDYTIQTFQIGTRLEDAPYNLSGFDEIQLAIRCLDNVFLFTADMNDLDNDLEHGIIVFRIPGKATRQMLSGRWPYDVQLRKDNNVVTPIIGTAVIRQDINRS